MKIGEIVTEDFDQYEPYNIAGPVPANAPPEIWPVDKYEKLASLIESHCSQMLNAYRQAGSVLYRGIRNTDDPAIITNIRQDRKPVEMPPDAHKRLEKAYTLLGLKANRTNSIFCTSDSDTATDWGKLYVIFVKDGWSGTVFESVVDEYVYDRIYGKATDPRYQNDIPGLAAQIKKLDPAEITPNNLVDVLQEGYKDLMITGTSYIALKWGSPPLKHVLEILGLNI